MTEQQSELELLRAEVAALRQREIDSLRDQLSSALESAQRWQAEARRISNAASELDQIRQATIAELKAKTSQTGNDHWSVTNGKIRQAQA